MNSVYIAAAYPRKLEMQDYVQQLHDAGIVCTSTWIITFGIDVAQPDALAAGGNASVVADEDIQDIGRAEAFMFFSSVGSEHQGRGGRHTEFGIALMLQKPIFIIGAREHVFHSLVPDNQVFEDFDAFYEEHCVNEPAT